MMKNKGIGIIFGIFLTIVVGVALLGSLADRGSVITNDIDILNETLNINEGFNGTDFNTSETFSLANTNWTTGSVSIAENTSALTLNTDYYLDLVAYTINFTNTSAVWRINQSSNLTGNAPVNYSYYHSDYISNAASRTLMGFIPLFFVIGILLFVFAKLMGYEWMNWLGKRK